jgi:choline-sulfatase
MSDQHQAEMLGCAGDSTVQTPNIDRLAGEGIRFDRVSCQGPLCMPARASFMTERYVRDHGVYTNWAEIPPDSPTYVSALRDAGYHTALVGKAHLYRDEGLQAEHTGEVAYRLQQLGFTDVLETGDKFPGLLNPYLEALQERGYLDAYRRHIADRSYQGENESGLNATKTVPMWDATPAPLPPDLYIDEWHGAQAQRWIEGFNDASPFFLFVGFPGPHDPWDSPESIRARYKPDGISMPKSTVRPELTGCGRYSALLDSFLWVSDSTTMTDEAVAGMRLAYAADISVVDDAVGRIVQALEARGMLDDTWVIYTSDHGEMAGSHGLMSKCVLYRQAVHVPLIFRPPGGCQPRSYGRLVEHVDVPATTRMIGGAPPLAESAGRVLPVVDSVAAGSGRDVAVSENWGFASFETDRYRLVIDEDAMEACQLFDLAGDPEEDRNLVADPAVADDLRSLMDTYVRPFFVTRPARPHPSLFTP